MQNKQEEWFWQWSEFHDDETFLFLDWIYPNTLDQFSGKVVLEAGCGGGQHTKIVSHVCDKITAVDLNSVSLARVRNQDSDNISFIEADIAEMDLHQVFDVIFSIGVVHHTDDPEKTVSNLIRHLKPGGRLILWVYSKEGNWIAENVVERLRSAFLSRASHATVMRLSQILTGFMYLPIYSVYLLPLRFLPYFEYFQNFRRLKYERNVLNVFDKLNAPQVQFIDRNRIQGWLGANEFSDVHISDYKNVSWRISASLAEGL